MRISTSGNSSGKSQKAGLLTALLVTGFGFVLSFFTTDLINATKESEQWPSVPGTVTEAEVESFTQRHDGKTQQMYSARVSVSYSVKGKNYSTSSFDMGGTSSTSVRFLAQRKLNDYPEGGTVDVYYDPEHPDFGILQPGMTLPWQILRFTPYLLYGIAGLILIQVLLRVLGIITALGFLAAKRKNAGENNRTSPAPPVTSALAQPEPEKRSPPPSPVEEDDGFSI